MKINQQANSFPYEWFRAHSLPHRLTQFSNEMYSAPFNCFNLSSFPLNFQGALQRVLKATQTAVDPDLELSEGSFILEEHYVQEKIRVVDTRGFSVSDEHLEDELLDILFGR